MLRFTGCNSIQSCSLVSDRFETKTMTWRELKRIGQIDRIVYSQPEATITQYDLSAAILTKLVDSCFIAFKFTQ